MIVRRALLLMVLAVISTLSLLLLAGHGPWSGPAVLRITKNHGLHSGDVPVLLLWLAGLGCCAVLWRRTR